MGSTQSFPGLTEDVLEDYTSLTYLTKGEILYLMKEFYSIDPEKVQEDFHHRFSKEEILTKFHVLQNNPFLDRIFSVFSSKGDDCFSFEDLVDLCSAMSFECPADVKAAWAFRIFDLDDDGQITAKDIGHIIDRLTLGVTDNRDHYIDETSKDKIAKGILDEINFDKSGGIGQQEFKLIMSRIPEFATSFYFRL
ncbi:calcium and integrin-binding protein 1-like [Spodoptera litura]|uniref:Calcium and integrin-binding protein 1-like n=1 Tax=Spodoptera litura TaxID=69820 RepID=A0A9J7J3D8_SPOLT|nr:calcium and integrin-binding protein 1-like [Spodoptera litura]